MRRVILYILCLAALVCSCSKKNVNTLDESVATTRDILLKVNDQFVRVDENLLQVCTGAHLFRAGNDDMSTYFSLSFDKYPDSQEETAVADLEWKVSGASQSRKGQEMTVVRITEGVIWLSADSGKINAVIRKN